MTDWRNASRDGAPATESAVEGTTGTVDGLNLFWRGWLPSSPSGVVVIVHGLAEHSGRYEHVGRHLAARGWAAYAVDTRAHGRSPGPKVHLRRFDEFLEDVRSMLAAVRRSE